jgi:hypothetical protein
MKYPVTEEGDPRRILVDGEKLTLLHSHTTQLLGTYGFPRRRQYSKSQLREQRPPQRRLSLAVARISLSLTGEALSRRWRLGFWNMASTAEGPSPSFICARKSQRIPRVRDEGCSANSGERPGSRCFYRELEDDPEVWGPPGGEWSGTRRCCLKGPTRR